MFKLDKHAICAALFGLVPLLTDAQTLLGPEIIKVFGAATIPLNGTTTLTFRLTNANATTTLTNITFTDTLPAGLVVGTPNGLNGMCDGGAISATPGSGNVRLSGATLTAGQQCLFAVRVTGTTAGVKNNVTGVISSNESGTGTTASASVTVVAPPVIAKAFGGATIVQNGTQTLTLTINNPNEAIALTGIGFTDYMGLSLIVADQNGLSTTCNNGTIDARPRSVAVILSGLTLAAGASCTITVNVLALMPFGQRFTNSVTVNSENGGSGNVATAMIDVIAAMAPTISKSFGTSTIVQGGTTTLTFTISNPDSATELIGLNFLDTLPVGMIVAAPNGLRTTCTAFPSLHVTATPGTNSVALGGVPLAPGGSCTLTVNVTTSVAAGGTRLTNSVTVSSTNGGTGNTATATVAVLAITDIPTLSEGMLIALAVLLGMGALAQLLARRPN